MAESKNSSSSSSTDEFEAVNNRYKKDDMIDGKYIITAVLDEGGYGQVVRAVKTKDVTDLSQITVALKLEKMSSTSTIGNEASCLKKLQGNDHIPKLYGFSTTAMPPYLVMEPLRSSLKDLRENCPSANKRFSLSTSVRVLRQLLDAFQHVHSVGLVHRDIKPGNVMVGFGENARRLYLVDFGLCRPFRNDDGDLIAPRPGSHMFGRNVYSSPNSHYTREQGCCDDLISLLYMIVELRKGCLPWSDERDVMKMAELKVSIPTNELTKTLPDELRQFGDIVRALKYADRPDYDQLTNLIDRIMTKNRFYMNESYDWDEEYGQVLREDKKEGGERKKK